jgi:hypothetical protein
MTTCVCRIKKSETVQIATDYATYVYTYFSTGIDEGSIRDAAIPCLEGLQIPK